TGSHIPDYTLHSMLAKTSALAMRFSRYLQSYDDYPSNGEFIDYLYWKQGTLALTFEVSDDKTPSESQLADIVARSVRGALAVAKGLRSYDRGELRLEPPQLYTAVDRRDPRWIVLGQKLE